MSNHYKSYLMSKCGYEVIEDAHGFVLYYINGKECHLAEVYIEPSKRRLGIATELAEKLTDIALDNECEWITCSTTIRGDYNDAADGQEAQSMMAALSFDFRPVVASGNRITYAKRIAMGV